MKAIVLYDTLFGNTERIAKRMATGLHKSGVEAESVNIKQAQVDRLAGYDLLALGAPTQYFTASKPLKAFLEQLKGVNLKGKRGFAFDTRLDSRLSGSAAKFIEKRLQELGIDIIRQRASALVVCEKGAKPEDTILKEGMEDLFESIGRELGTLLKKAQQVGAA
jgi:flavorubredoxin